MDELDVTSEGGDGVKKKEKEPLARRVMKVALAVVTWIVLAFVAAIITAFVRGIPQRGIWGTLLALWYRLPEDRHWWSNFLDVVILVVSLVVAVRIIYPPKDLDDDQEGESSGSRQEDTAPDLPIR